MGILATVGCIRGVGVQFSTGRLGDSPSRQSRQASCLPFCYVHAQESESIALVLTTIFFFWLLPTTCPPACIHTLHTFTCKQASVRTAKINKLNHYYSGFFSWLHACVRACVRAAPRDRKKEKSPWALRPEPEPERNIVTARRQTKTLYTKLMNYRGPGGRGNYRNEVCFYKISKSLFIRVRIAIILIRSDPSLERIQVTPTKTKPLRRGASQSQTDSGAIGPSVIYSITGE